MINISSKNRQKLKRSLDNQYFIETEIMKHASTLSPKSISSNNRMTDESIMGDIHSKTRNNKTNRKTVSNSRNSKHSKSSKSSRSNRNHTRLVISHSNSNINNNNSSNNFNSNLFSFANVNNVRKSRTSIGGILARFSGNSQPMVPSDYKSYINQHFEDLIYHMYDDPNDNLNNDLDSRKKSMDGWCNRLACINNNDRYGKCS